MVIVMEIFMVMNMVMVMVTATTMVITMTMMMVMKRPFFVPGTPVRWTNYHLIYSLLWSHPNSKQAGPRTKSLLTAARATVRVCDCAYRSQPKSSAGCPKWVSFGTSPSTDDTGAWAVSSVPGFTQTSVLPCKTAGVHVDGGICEQIVAPSPQPAVVPNDGELSRRDTAVVRPHSVRQAQHTSM